MKKKLLALATLLFLPATAMASGGFSFFMLLPGGKHLFYFYAALFVFAFLIVAAFTTVGTRKPAEMVVPEPRLTLRNFFELIIGFIYGLAKEIIGHQAKRYLPLLGTCFLFILFMNLMGLIPGFLPPTQMMNITLGLALVIFFSTHFFGIRESGFKYFKHFLGPMPVLAPLMLPIEIISHLARPLSLSLRLFGNMTGDHAVVGAFLAMGAIGWFIPAIFMGLGLFVCFLQAFIFTILSTIYIGGAIAHTEEHH